MLDSEYSPAALREAAGALRSGAAGVPIAGATIEPDGSGLYVLLAVDGEAEEGVSARRSGPDRQEQLIQQAVEFPVTFGEEPQTAAASRQSDTAGLAGARIKEFIANPGRIGGQCSSAFSLRRGETGDMAQLTAAHCGALNSTWVIHDGVQGSNQHYLLGQMTQRHEYFDAAVIDSQWSYPYMYTGAWNSNTYTPINGLVVPVVGVELCYSGSYSGLHCGSIVIYPEMDVTYRDQWGNPIQTSFVFVAQQASGQKTVGQGDSGGPGYVLASTSTGFKRYAATIISGISEGTTGCIGEDYRGRLCSSISLSTSVSRALGALGWSLQTVS